LAGGAFHWLGAEAGGDGQPASVVIGIDDTACPEGDGDPGGVQANRVAPVVAAHHEDICPGRLGEMRADRAPAVSDVVARTGRGGGIHASGQGHEHGVGVRHEGEVGEQPSPLKAAHRPQAVGRHPGMRRAVARAPSPAWQACPAGDLERNDHEVARGNGGDCAANLHDPGDGLMPEGIRAGERVGAAQYGDIDVTGRHRQGPHDRRRRIVELRLVYVVPPELRGTFEKKLAHHRTIVLIGRSSCQHG